MKYRLMLDRGVLSGIASIFFLISMAGAAEKPSWEAEWKRTVEAAKKEGRVMIYISPGTSTLVFESGRFQKRFPEIKVVISTGNPTHRILTERRAGKYLADVAMGGVGTPVRLYLGKALDPMRDAMILPEVLDESLWWGGKHRYADQEMKYAFSYIGKQDRGTVYYNTNQVNPNEFKSFYDFLNPKWKGKITARDMRKGGPGGAPMRFLYFNPKLGPKFITRLFSEMDITLFRDRRQGVDWLATGRYSICFFCSDIGQAKMQGLPVDAFGLMKEGAGLSASTGNVGFVNRAPHPNAAKVFLNWLLSREGQITMQTEYAKNMTGNSNSLRIDIPKDMVPVNERLSDDIDYIEVDSWARRGSMRDIYKVFTAALAKARK